ncbi:MAG: adenylate cyclase, partial [Microvirga sp.]|nr:adenylate cyclase [Microvirga sp.]
MPEAGRLRRALERYYLSGGLSDPVVITIPKGAYVPHFAWRTPQAVGAYASSEDAFV